MKVTRSFISNPDTGSYGRTGFIPVDDSSEVSVGDKYTIEGVNSVIVIGWNSDGSPKYCIGEFVLTAIQLKDDMIYFFPTIHSEGAYRNVTSMITKGMELKELT
mgnify:CR=1 FL=1